MAQGVSEVLQNLGALIVNLAPHGWATYVTEGREVDIRNELCTRENKILILTGTHATTYLET